MMLPGVAVVAAVGMNMNSSFLKRYFSQPAACPESHSNVDKPGFISM
jgi:hypothetical protein